MEPGARCCFLLYLTSKRLIHPAERWSVVLKRHIWRVADGFVSGSLPICLNADISAVSPSHAVEVWPQADSQSCLISHLDPSQNRESL
ncbi:hypothetical protein NPIL_434371 [Nephila pilipes]|uniref:Uncharacterized protein n=1 Tax=Nephila pilipes TaxID=299642 RepID=A0A8X6TYJ9_NEPPI|nr:hypothetical protein NPIL_434371 [Nephila pilipes]